MSYDLNELDHAIRAGEPLPDELLDIFKKNAARRRSAKIETRLHKVSQHLQEIAKARKPSPLTRLQQRSRRGGPGFPSSKSVPEFA